MRFDCLRLLQFAAPAILASALVAPAPAAAAPITYEISFTLDGGSTPPAPSGTITLDDSDGLFGNSVVLFSALTTPYSFDFTEGASVWTEDDFIDSTEYFTPTLYFVGGMLDGLLMRVYDTNDQNPPGSGDRPLFFDYSPSRIWRTEPNSGTYSIEPASTAVVPEPATLLLLGSGLATLAARRRVVRRSRS